MGYIYKITNTKSNKCYIGETKEANPETRWKRHLNTISKGRGCPALQDAVIKYGIENFKFEVLIICFDEDRFEYEKQYIKKYNSIVPNGYNILEGGLGGGGFKGKKHTPETLEKISKTSKGRLLSQESRNKISIGVKESMKSIDISKRMKESEKWKKAVEKKRIDGQSLEVKEKISKGLKAYYNKSISTEPKKNIEKHRESMTKAVGKPVSQYTLDGTFVASFKSIAEASRSTGVSVGLIVHVLKGRNKTGGGFIWKYNS